MTCKKTLEWPDLRLMKRSKNVEAIDDSVLSIIDDMICTLDKNDYVGLAACQIGQNKRIFVLDMQKVSFLDNSDDSKNIFVAINPEIVDGFGEEISLETCLTFPGQEFYVPRASFISFTYKDIEGNEIEMNATGFLSIQVQYMIDAIDGHHLVDTLTPSARRQAIEKLEMKKSESEDTEELYAIYGGD